MILRNSAIYIGGEVFSKIVPMLFLPYLTRTLGVGGFGQLAYYLAIIQFIGIFVGISSHSAISRYYFRYGSRSISLPITAVLIFGAIVSALFSISGSMFGEHIAMLLAISAFANCLLACGLSLMQCQKKAVLYIVLQMANVTLSVVLTILLFESYGYHVIYRLNANLVAMVIIVLLIASMSGLRFKTWKPSKLLLALRYLLGFGLPMMVHAGCNFIRFEMDKLILKDILSADQFGIYALAAKIGALVQLMLIAINKSIQPAIYEALKGGRNVGGMQRYNYISWAVAVIPVFVLYLIPEQLLLAVFGYEFTGVKSLTLIFVFGYSLLAPYFLYSNIAFYHGWSGLLSWSALLSIIMYLSVFSFLLYVQRPDLVPWALAFSSLFLTLLLTAGVSIRLKVERSV